MLMVELTLERVNALSERVSQVLRIEQVYGPFLEGEGGRPPSGRRYTHTKKSSHTSVTLSVVWPRSSSALRAGDYITPRELTLNRSLYCLISYLP